jgi:uncharacterized protein (TIGR02246 family)
MAGELESKVRSLFEALDRGDTAAAKGSIAQDAQGIDEISRRWMRGHDELGSYVEQMMREVSAVHSEIHDAHERVWGDVGVLTCWLEQDYTLENERTHVSCPTTIVLRRENGEWRFALFHSTPLPAES